MLWRHLSASLHWSWWYGVKPGWLRIDSGVWEAGATCSILTRLQQLDPIFHMGVDVMRPAYNFEPQYRVTMLTREDWAKATGVPPAVKGLVWYADGSMMREGAGVGVYGPSVRRRLSFPLGRYATIFQAEIYAILACAHEIQSQNRPEKYVFAPIVQRPWRPLTLLERRLHWYTNAKRR